MRRDKVSEIIGGKSVLERVISCLSSFKGEVIVVRARGQSVPHVAGYANLRFVEDIYPEKGPLGGIYTGLTESKSDLNLVVAGDMPFLNSDLLRHIIEAADGFELVIPRINNMLEPLHAIYSRKCLPPIERLLKQDILTVYRLLDMVKVRYIELEEIDRYDPRHLSFFNVNTEADLEEARRLADEGYDKC